MCLTGIQEYFFINIVMSPNRIINTHSVTDISPPFGKGDGIIQDTDPDS